MSMHSVGYAPWCSTEDLLVLLLIYHWCLLMTSEVIELRVEGEQVNHSWYMCVVGQVYGWLGGAEMKVVNGMHTGQSLGVGRMWGDAAALPECEVIH